MSQQKIDIVLPCFRPEKEWYSGLQEFYQKFGSNYDLTIYVVNDGWNSISLKTDVDKLLILDIPVKMISYDLNQGKGYALRQGVAQTTADHIVYTDIDFPFLPESVNKIILCLTNENADIAVGYREGDYYKNDFSAYRKILSKTFRFFLRNILKMPITDTQCGLKGFSVKGKELFLRTTINRYLFDFEFIYMASRTDKYKLVAVPVTLKDNVKFSKMKLKVLIQESANLFKVLLKRKF
jgi:glycosyltransferase involved in cell wall biosynthesis